MSIKGKVLSLIVIILFLTSCFATTKPVFATTNQDSWAKLTPMPTARFSLGVAATNEKIYAIGGSTEKFLTSNYDSGGIVGANEEYDPTTNQWTTKTHMPIASAGFAIATFQNKIYCFGGSFENSSSITQVYDPSTDTWSFRAPKPAAAGGQAMVANGKIYLTGNSNGVFAYDPMNDSWTAITPMPIFDQYLASAPIGDKIFVFVKSRITSSTAFYSQALIFDTFSGNWSTLKTDFDFDNFIWQYSAGATTGEMAPRRIYIFSGWGGYGSPLQPFYARGNNSNQIYNPYYNIWSFGAEIPTTRVGFGVAILHDKLYVIGGYTQNFLVPFDDNLFNKIPSAVNEVYTPEGYGVADPVYLLDATPPKISILATQNQAYNESSVSFLFSVNKTVIWAGYSLDGERIVTATTNGTLSRDVLLNVTLANVTEGIHSFRVYANDTFGNSVESDNITFRVLLPKQEEPYQLIIIGVALAAVLIGTGLLVYLKRNKKAL